MVSDVSAVPEEAGNQNSVTCGDLIRLKGLGAFRNEFRESEPLVHMRNAAARLSRDGEHVVTRLRGFEQRSVRHRFFVWVHILANGFLDQLVFENLIACLSSKPPPGLTR